MPEGIGLKPQFGGTSLRRECLNESTSGESATAQSDGAAKAEYYRRIGKKGGESLKQDRGREHFQDIARRGGQACMKNRGREHFQVIGKQGGKVTRERHGIAFYSRIGKLGAEARQRRRKQE